jgi:hypothetical protein
MLIKNNNSQAPVLRPIILATWEAEIRRIVVQGQLGQRVCKTLSQKYLT